MKISFENNGEEKETGSKKGMSSLLTALLSVVGTIFGVMWNGNDVKLDLHIAKENYEERLIEVERKTNVAVYGLDRNQQNIGDINSRIDHLEHRIDLIKTTKKHK